MIETKTKLEIIEVIKQRDDWINTLPDNDEDFQHSYFAFELFGQIIILSEFFNRHENSSEFYHWKEGKMIDVTEEEDFVMRAAYNDGLRDEVEMDCLIDRDSNNIVYEGASKFPTPKEVN